MQEYSPMEVTSLLEEEVTRSLEDLLREGSRRMLQAALEMEVATYIEQCKEQVNGRGHRQVVRNGHHAPREVVTGVWPIPIRQPRVHDRRRGQVFSSAILPPYLRRTPSIDALIPALYLQRGFYLAVSRGVERDFGRGGLGFIVG